jgi:hypothetical protein
MRHQHVGGVTAVDGYAESPRRVADVFVPSCAQPALAAPDPRKGCVALSLVHTLRVGSRGLHGAGDLVPECEGQLPRAAHVQLLPAAKIEVAILQMQVRVADSAVADTQ